MPQARSAAAREGTATASSKNPCSVVKVLNLGILRTE
jgi:hypothetical protein